MMLHRLWRRGRSILIICVLGTNISHALAQTHTPGTSQLGGFAYLDRNNNGVLAFSTDPNPEFVIPGVEIKLFSQAGLLLGTQLTDSSGRYFFDNLVPGTYTIRQTQPVKYVDGLDTLGSLASLTTLPVPGSGFAGIVGADEFTNIELPADVRGDFYNFGELGLAPGYASKRFLLTTTPRMNYTPPPPQIVPEDPSPELLIPEPGTGLTGLMALAGATLLARRRRKPVAPRRE